MTIRKFRPLYSPPPPCILKIKSCNATEAGRCRVKCSWVTAIAQLFGICQAVWPQKQPLKDELATSASQHWAAGATAGPAHAVQQLHSCLLLHLNLVQRDSDLEAVWDSSYGRSVGSAGLECPCLWRAAGSLTWEDVERWAVTTGTTGGKNWHEGETLITWEMLFCLSNEQNQYCRGFIKFVFDENLCSDETVIPTGCFTIIFLTASKACVWRCMESKY